MMMAANKVEVFEICSLGLPVEHTCLVNTDAVLLALREIEPDDVLSTIRDLGLTGQESWAIKRWKGFEAQAKAPIVYYL